MMEALAHTFTQTGASSRCSMDLSDTYETVNGGEEW